LGWAGVFQAVTGWGIVHLAICIGVIYTRMTRFEPGLTLVGAVFGVLECNCSAHSIGVVALGLPGALRIILPLRQTQWRQNERGSKSACQEIDSHCNSSQGGISQPSGHSAI
jgi:hypothetical protein